MCVGVSVCVFFLLFFRIYIVTAAFPSNDIIVVEVVV